MSQPPQPHLNLDQLRAKSLAVHARQEQLLPGHEGRLLRAIFDHTFEFIGVLSPDGLLVDANATALERTGVTREVMGRPFWEAPWWSHDPALQRQLQEAVRQAAAGEFVRFEATHPGPDGSWLVIDFSLKPVRDDEGRVVWLIPEGRDITERKQTERELAERTRQLELANQELQEADRYKDEFLSVISHELRTPLNAILGFAALLQDGVGGPLTPDQTDYLERILAGGGHMLHLVGNLLDFSRMAAGQFRVLPLPGDFGALLTDVLQVFGPLGRARELSVVGQVAELPEFSFDPVRMRQVLDNLLDNALKFTPPGGTVTVAARVVPAGVRVEVRDTGPGIAPEGAARLFRRFVQLDMSTTRAAGGTGLGLAICKGIVESHGGRIGVESVTGGGSTFYFELPSSRAIGSGLVGA